MWVRGRPIANREGYRWAPDHWEQEGGAYHRQPGYWVRNTNYAHVKDKKGKYKHKNKDGKEDDHDD